MALRSMFYGPPGNLSPGERVMSLLAGIGLASAALTRGGLLRRAALTASGLTFLARGATGFCGVKAAYSGDATLREGVREHWQRTRSQLGGGAGGIKTLHDLYTEEVQELADSTTDLQAVLESLRGVVTHPELAGKLDGYVGELRGRADDLRRMLAGSVSVGAHPDQAFGAMLAETRKMRHVASVNVRDAALIDSLQRLVHYQIAAYGSVSAYAKAMGRHEEASRLADYADRDKAFDAELSELAIRLVNRNAATAPLGAAATEVRPH
jgi:ferritin-like metal-binding protein YciE